MFKMIGCYVTGILPRTKELVELTRAYERGKADERELEKAFEDATLKAINAQSSAGLTYITDGMLKWQDLLRPFTENLAGVKAGSLSRWFNNNTFYRKPVIVDEIKREKSIIQNSSYIKLLPRNIPWKAILPAPYTFAQLSENQFYKSSEELMFKYAKILNEEIKSLAKLGFKYVQLSDPALVYKPFNQCVSKDKINAVSEALKAAVDGVQIKTCLQTFFGDFCKILPEALDFPIDHLGIDLYETDLNKLKDYHFDKGIALGLVDARNSLVEEVENLIESVKEIVESLHGSRQKDIFVCPNCDLEFLPWERAQEKMHAVGSVAKRLREELNE
jgi:5-methyltetrahydropteroyltriglutamate--homocysteine methyltransferase